MDRGAWRAIVHGVAELNTSVNKPLGQVRAMLRATKVLLEEHKPNP